MQISEYKNIFENEGTHFFYQANHQIVLALVRRYLKITRPKILDAGCGTGLLAKKLAKFGVVWGIDINNEAIKFSRSRGVKVKKASVMKIPFKKNTFDLVVSVDVIYHSRVDDIKALREFYRVLKPGGILILRVPANKWLKLAHDVHVHTRERYTYSELRRKLLQAGFEIKLLSFVNMILLLLAFLKQIRERYGSRDIRSGVGDIHPFLNQLLLMFLLPEGYFLKFINLPFGLGLIAVGRK